MTVDTLDVYAIACLAGGTPRLVDTALVALVESGRVRVPSPGELATVSPVRRHPVEAAVLDAIGPAGGCWVETVRWRLTTDERILDVTRRLRDAGLLEPGGRTSGSRRSRWRLEPTYAGRHVLHVFRDAPPPDDLTGSPSAPAVALHGRERMADKALCAAIFEQPRSATAPAPGSAAPWEPGLAGGAVASRHTRAEILARVRQTDTTGFGAP